ncbi:hypothetical protein D3C75_715150 [compost metagenome]
MPEDFLKHQRVWLATGLVSRAGDVEEPLPAIGLEHPIQPATGLAGGHRQAVTLGTEGIQRLDHAIEQRRRLLIQRNVDISIVLAEAGNLCRRQVRVQGVDRLVQGQTDDTLDRSVAALRLAGTLCGDIHGLDDTPNGIGQGAIPVEDQ